ncbi:MAG: alpha-hydroxy-acid oxidizing protein [Acidobacteria bacterium]|nr:alpha-hydroxy-acid oxidizing protein [Acidobacteriota bacterium]
MQRRECVRNLLGLFAGSPLFAQQAPDDVNLPINVHEFEEAAKRKLHKFAYDFIAGGTEDEHTLRANREAFSRVFLVPKFMTDVSDVSTGVDLLGLKLKSPVIIAPTGGKNLVINNADELVAQAALNKEILICTATGVQKLLADGKPLNWWSNTIGSKTKDQARGFARRTEDGGGKGIVVTIDNSYQSNRDRNNRNRFDYGYMSFGVPKDGEVRKPVNPARPAMWQPHTPSMTWEYIEWLKSGSSIPVLIKGVLHPEDAALAVKNGADAVIVSNHGGRQLDGAIGSLDALPDVVDAVGGKIPVLMDGGIRRGGDVAKALALGAKAVLVGRAPLWGLGAYGQAGVERVLQLLTDETRLAIALSGKRRPAEMDRSIVKRMQVWR